MKTSGFNEHLTDVLAYKLSPLWVILLACLSLTASAQLDDAKQQINYLQEGTLYVVIPTYSKKIELLKTQLNTDLSKVERERVAKLLQETIQDRDRFEKAIKAAFDEAYKFSNYIFIKDQAIPELLANIKPGDQKGTFFLDRSTTENGASALVLSNHLRQELKRPVPYFARIGKGSAIFEAFFGSSEVPWRDLTKVVRKLDQRLSKFQQK